MLPPIVDDYVARYGLLLDADEGVACARPYRDAPWCVVIPAYNAGRHIEERGAPRSRRRGSPISRASSSSTTAAPTGRAERSRRCRRLPCAFEVIGGRRNGGYGAAMKDGLERALAPEPGACRLRARRRTIQPRGPAVACR